MRKPSMQELKCPKHRPANDNWAGARVGSAARTPKSAKSNIARLAILISGLSGLAVCSCLLGIGTVELFIR
jgi:hypothetical protein